MVAPLANEVLLFLVTEQNESFIIKLVVNSEAVALWAPCLLKIAFCHQGWGSGFRKDEMDWESLWTSTYS